MLDLTTPNPPPTLGGNFLLSPLPGRERVWVWVASQEFAEIGNGKIVIPSEAEAPYQVRPSTNLTGNGCTRSTPRSLRFRLLLQEPPPNHFTAR
jgi:hypothetical protein